MRNINSSLIGRNSLLNVDESYLRNFNWVLLCWNDLLDHNKLDLRNLNWMLVSGHDLLNTYKMNLRNFNWEFFCFRLFNFNLFDFCWILNENWGRGRSKNNSFYNRLQHNLGLSHDNWLNESFFNDSNRFNKPWRFDESFHHWSSLSNYRSFDWSF